MSGPKNQSTPQGGDQQINISGTLLTQSSQLPHVVQGCIQARVSPLVDASNMSADLQPEMGKQMEVGVFCERILVHRQNRVDSDRTFTHDRLAAAEGLPTIILHQPQNGQDVQNG